MIGVAAYRLYVRVNDWLARVTAGLVVLMMLTVVYDVLARMIFRAPTMWVIDINEYMLLYATFVPAAWILLRDSHVKIELVVQSVGPRTRRVLDVFSNVCGLFYCIILAWQGWLVAWQSYEAGYRFSTALSAPQFPVYVIIPIGAAWLGLAFVFKIIGAVPPPASAEMEQV